MVAQRNNIFNLIPRAKAKRVGAKTAAGLVFDHIPSGPDATPISGEELKSLTGLTLAQIQYGVAYLRDTHPDFPLVSSTKGYLFTTEPVRVRVFRRARAKSALTIIRRLWYGVIKPFISQPGFDTKEGQQVTKQFERVIEDLADIIA